MVKKHNQKTADNRMRPIAWLLPLLLAVAGIWFGLNYLQTDQATPDVKPEAPLKPEPFALRLPIISPEPMFSDEAIEDIEVIIDELFGERKQIYGLEKELDHIIQPHESLVIGELHVPMAEILKKIQQREKRITEKDLDNPNDQQVQATEQELLRKLAELQTRLVEIEQLLADPAISEDMRRTLEIQQEKETRLVGAGNRYKEIKEIIERIERDQDASPDPGGEPSDQATRLDTLRTLKQKLEAELQLRLFPLESIEAYGVYLVQPEDNVWKIHYRMLESSLIDQGYSLSPGADRPNPHGFSSGVGKVLKFAEGLVYIYNIQQAELTDDLNFIQPYQKIIVFNMQKIFSLLEHIDIQRLDEIIFDGQVLWFPSR